MKANFPSIAILLVTAILPWTLPSSVRADSDIDFDNGTLYIETDEHDDVILIRNEWDQLAVYILQMDEDTFQTAQDAYKFRYDFPQNQLSAAEFYETFEDLAERDRDYHRDIDDVSTIVIDSGDGDDCIVMQVGDHRKRILVAAGEGNDFVSGTTAQYWIYGEAGEDKLSVGTFSATSFLSGGDGDDELSHSSVNFDATILGGNGNDKIRSSGDGRIFAWGEAGDDEIVGGYGNDRLYGGDGNDTINGFVGNDSLFGGDGMDELFGLHGNDFLDGGYDGFIDFLDGGPGFDKGITKYFRAPSKKFANKFLTTTLEAEEFENLEVQSAVQK